MIWKSDSSKNSYFPVSLSLWQAPGQVVEFLSGEVFKIQLRQILAGNVLDINDSTSGFQSKASVFFCKMIARTPSEISLSISLLFFKFCRMSAKHENFVDNKSKTRQHNYRTRKEILEMTTSLMNLILIICNNN